jgi:hypothetical protein
LVQGDEGPAQSLPWRRPGSFGWGIAALHRLHAATKLPSPRRPPHRISRSHLMGSVKTGMTAVPFVILGAPALVFCLGRLARWGAAVASCLLVARAVAWIPWVRKNEDTGGGCPARDGGRTGRRRRSGSGICWGATRQGIAGGNAPCPAPAGIARRPHHRCRSTCPHFSVSPMGCSADGWLFLLFFASN